VLRFGKHRFLSTLCFVYTRCKQKPILTVLRFGVEKTISTFFKERKEKIVSRTNKIKPIKHISIQTSHGKYVVAPYFDTTPMISIAQIS
jgi:hypothetical protein